MNVTFRPLEDWPKEKTAPLDRQRSRFDSSWSQTLNLLNYELSRVGAASVIIRLSLEDKDIRRDGWPRSTARPTTPGVVVEWLTRNGWSRMAADKYDHWHDNVRAIALSLEALRAVERWGAVEGEQYEGLRLELEEAGSGDTTAAQTLIDSYGGLREALKATHPDQGGDAEEFRRVQEARRILENKVDFSEADSRKEGR